MLKLMEQKKLWFWLSAALLVPGIVSLLVWGLKPGIDFRGGSLTEFKYPDATKIEQGSDAIKKAFTENGLHELQIQNDIRADQDVRLFVKSQSIEQTKHLDILRRLKENQPPLEELSFETIDPQVGQEVTRRAVTAIIVASLVIILYIALSFRGVPKPTSSWQFGITAVIALLHDVLFILGFYSIMGHFFGWEVNADFVTAALTVMGFSVHDTIVVFDRLRENLRRYPGQPFNAIGNISLSQTIARSLNTSLTVVLVLLAIVLLGGENIRPFSLTLLVGIAAGTYSSIFVATPLLEVWQRTKFKWPRLSLRVRRGGRGNPLKWLKRSPRPTDSR